MRPRVLFSLTFVLFSSFLCFAQPQGVKIANKSQWIETKTFDPAARPSEAEAASYFFLLFDEQENTITQEDYFHYAYKILTAEGIQDMSDLSITFDPAYQEVAFHEIKVMRGETVINQLSKNINVIQREQSMDRYLYDGSKTAVVNLRDIRIGDVIEYSFTRKGYNPVHQGHIARDLYFDVYQPIDRYFKRIVLSPKKKYNLEYIGTVHEPVEKNTTAALDYSWSFDKLKATDYNSGAPVWFDSGNGVMISDFSSWREVGEWGKKLFELPAEQRKRIYDDVASTFTETDPREYALKVIRFVQDEVRYLGFESGINSHKPYPPFQVYEQRFGDCKDKSLLLTTLLNARGIEAYPMLVNTSWKQMMDVRLPAGNIFDHCVVQLIIDGKKIYIDPTISSQGGTLDTYPFPNYRRGLVIDNDVEGLEKLPEAVTPTTTEIHNFEVLTVGGEAMLSIRTVYTGSSADFQRAQFARYPIETMQKDYRDYYTNLYPDITTWEDLVVTDNRPDNILITQEKYKIPTFWKPVPNEDGKIQAVVQPLSIMNYFDVPKSIQQRTTPYYLSYPVDYTHTTTIKLPEEWTIEPIDKIIENDLYQYEYTTRSDFTEITRMMHYTTKSDYVPADKIPAFVTDHASMYNDLVYQLTYDNNIAAAKTYNWLGIVFTIIFTIGAALLSLRLFNRYDPDPPRYMVQGIPIGGWLILMAIGITITPLRLLYDFSTSVDVMSGSSWITYFAAKHYAWFAYFLFTQVFNLLLFMMSVVVAVLFYQRRSSFPRLMSIQIVAYLFVAVFDSIVVYSTNAEPSSTDFKQLIQTFFVACLWLPYLNISQRVKETFVIRGPHHGDDATPEDEPAEKVEENIVN